MLECASKFDFPTPEVLLMAAGSDQTPKQLYKFGPFRVDPEKELLLRGDET